MAALDALNLNHLLVFAAVVEAGSFTAAAQRLGLSKAAMSQRISELERAAGVPLVHGLNVARRSIGNQILVDAVGQSIERVQQGGRLGQSLADCKSLFSGSTLEMISVAEESGKLDGELVRIALVTEGDVVPNRTPTVSSSVALPKLTMTPGLVPVIVTSEFVAAPKRTLPSTPVDRVAGPRQGLMERQ